MDELIRAKMHEALDVEQPDSRLRSRVLSSLPADEHVDRAHKSEDIPLGRRTELAAGIAAVVLAAIVIGTFTYIQAVARPHSVAPPITSASPTPSPTPLSQPLNVDPAKPVILFYDPGFVDYVQIDGMTWDGQASGKVFQIPAGVEGAGPNNFSGTLFVNSNNTAVLNRSGHVVARLATSTDPRGGGGFGVWADDDLHFCKMAPDFATGADSEPGRLLLATPGGTARIVTQIGKTYQSVVGLGVAACSVLSDRAVVVQYAPEAPFGIAQYWVVQLSSGRVLWTHEAPPPVVPTRQTSGTSTQVFASRDGRYVAEVQSTGTTIIYGPTGSAVGHVTGYVRGFSWDGSLAVVGASSCPLSQSCPYGGQASVIRWLDGAVVWAAPRGQDLAGVQPEPGGTNVAVATIDSGHRSFVSYPTVIYVVSADGQVIAQQRVADSHGFSFDEQGFL